MPRHVYLAYLQLWLLLATLPASGNAQQKPTAWAHEVKAGRFQIHCDFHLSAEDALLRELNEISKDVEGMLRLKPLQAPIHIVLFASEDEYRRYMHNYFPTLPQRRALFIQDRGPGMLFTHWHQEVASDLRHEVTHALLNRLGATMPLWLDEGLAEYFEMRRGERFRRLDYASAAQRLSVAGQLQSITVLAKKSHVAKLSNADYRDSWAWIHFLLHRSSKTRALLVRYLHETLERRSHSKGAVFDLERALRHQLPDVDEQLQDHFARVVKPEESSLPSGALGTIATSGKY